MGVAVMGERAEALETLTMRPAGDWRSEGSMACLTESAPRKLVSPVRITASALAVLGGPSGGSAIPALLTRMSSLPWAFAMSAAAASMLCRLAKSSSWKWASMFSDRSFDAAA